MFILYNCILVLLIYVMAQLLFSFLDKWDVMLSLFIKLVKKHYTNKKSFTSDFHSRRSEDWTNGVARQTTWCDDASIASAIQPASFLSDTLLGLQQHCFSITAMSECLYPDSAFWCEQPLYYGCAGHASFVQSLEYLMHSGPDRT